MVSANVSDEITEKSLDQVQRENEAKLLERKVSDDTKAFFIYYLYHLLKLRT